MYRYFKNLYQEELTECWQACPGCGILKFNYRPSRACMVIDSLYILGVLWDSSHNRALTLSRVNPKIGLLP